MRFTERPQPWRAELHRDGSRLSVAEYDSQSNVKGMTVGEREQARPCWSFHFCHRLPSYASALILEAFDDKQVKSAFPSLAGATLTLSLLAFYALSDYLHRIWSSGRLHAGYRYGNFKSCPGTSEWDQRGTCA